jgi:galactokinase
VSADAVEIDLGLSGTSWEFFLQDVVKRSRTLAYISVVAAFTCSRMRPDGFGGMTMVITADAIRGKSTNDLVEEFLSEAGLDDDAADAARRGAP